MPPQQTSLRAALSEQQTAGSPVAPARSVWSLLRRGRLAFRKWRRSETSVHDLSARELRDIGLTQSDIDCINACRAIERLRDSARYPW